MSTHNLEFFKYANFSITVDLATRIRFRTPKQMKAMANTTSDQSNKKSMKAGDPCMAEMEE